MPFDHGNVATLEYNAILSHRPGHGAHASTIIIPAREALTLSAAASACGWRSN
jgi:hypothetical protein